MRFTGLKRCDATAAAVWCCSEVLERIGVMQKMR